LKIRHHCLHQSDSRVSFIGRIFLIPALIVFISAQISGQTPDIDYNEYYKYPFSIGFEYQNLSPFSEYASSFNIFDLSVNLRWPIPSIPEIQPALRLGMMDFDSQDQAEPMKWDHTHWYGEAGAIYAYRFSRNFEIGGELMLGFSQALFPHLLPDVGTVSTANMLFEAGGRLCLNPSYNFSIDIHPSLKYLLSLGELKDYNGFMFGIGFSASYRFGKDPDAPAAMIRSLEFKDIEIPDLFAAMQSYYVEHPLGTITITNTEKYEIQDLKVSFFQAGFMDSPTPSASIPSLPGGESIEVPIYASFNREVFTVEGVTPLTGEIISSYSARGKPAEQKISVTYDLHDKTSIVWDDDRKVGAFITPADSALQNYSSFIRQSCKENSVPTYPEAVQSAIQIFYALGEIGCLYQVDPTQPFANVQGDMQTVDSISLPRNTLKNITGDCDDLTVLYCSLQETIGVETAFITIPGHIYAACNTRVPARDFSKVHPDRNMTLAIDGELWIPVEITMIGKAGFLEAWRTGIEEWNRYDASERAFYKTRESQKLYRPVGLRETDMGLQYGSGEDIDRNFSDEMNRIISLLLEGYQEKASSSATSQNYNSLGIAYARYRRYRQAENAFNQAIRIDPEYIGARINLANLQYLRENYTAAVRNYENLYTELEKRGSEKSTTALKILINLARASYKLERYDRASDYFMKAKAINPALTEKYEYLSTDSNNSSGRGAGRNYEIEESIMFAGEDE